MSPARRRTALVTGAAVLATLGCAGTAGAHIQLTPSTVAPNDPVEFTVIVPSERPAHTTRVDLKLPPGVIPFAYGETPGWKRRLITASNGAIERVVWTGKLAEDGYARFTFLAGTPEKPATLTWKALQTYDDGTIARWIGSPDSDSPAPVTKVIAGAPRQNAGGEGESGTETAATAPDTGTPSTPDAPSTAVASAGDDGTDWLARGLGIAAVLIALAGAALAVRRRSS
ncbi:DUF1775 domain-containing protein [Patulibacter sp. NPDC049589]|uniref:DUF1775 domain-containing protein n=1 Tax=Patulibacter sp. NPDC049589 TaxID=3154731 RepID=UPI0034471BF6